MSSNSISEACTSFLSAVGELVSGETTLNASEHHAHRAGCESCAAEYGLAMQIQAELSSMPEIEPPSAMWAALQPRLDEVDATETVRQRERAPVMVPRLVRSPARG